MVITNKFGLFISTCLLFFSYVASVSFDGRNSFYICMFFLFVMFILFIRMKNFMGKVDYRQPWILASIFNVPFWLIGSFSVFNGISFLSMGDIEYYAGKAVFIVLLAFYSIYIGYILGSSSRINLRKFLPKNTIWTVDISIVMILLIYIVCLVARYNYYYDKLIYPFMIYMANYNHPALFNDKILSTDIPILLVPLLWTLYLSSITKKNKILILIGFVSFIEFSWGLVKLTSKSYIIYPFVAPILPYIIARHKFNLKLILIPFAVLILFAYPYVNIARSIYFEKNVPRDEALVSTLNALVDTYSQLDFSKYIQEGHARYSGLGSIIHLLKAFDQGMPTLGGYEYYMAPLAAIPRIFWPDKPIIAPGARFRLLTEGQESPYEADISQVVTSVASTTIGSFLWNLGYFGVIFTSLFFGYASAVFYKNIIVYNLINTPGGIMLYIGFLNILNLTESTVIALPAIVITSLSLPLIINKFLTHRVK